MSEQINWSDGMASRSRSPFLVFIKEDEIHLFGGEDIPGVVVVRGTDYEKNGKWSYTMYRLQLAARIRHISGYAGWETGRFVEGLGSATGCPTPDTWSDLAKAFGVSVPSAMAFARKYKPRTTKKLDEVEKSLQELEDASDKEADFEIVMVSFGSPTNRAIQAGYWEAPKNIPGYEADICLIDPDKGWEEGNIEVIGITGTVLSVRHSRGIHGGYYAVSVAVM